MLETIAVLVAALFAAIGVAVAQTYRGRAARLRADTAERQAKTDRKRIVTERDRREQAEAAGETHAQAIEEIEAQRVATQRAIVQSRKDLAGLSTADLMRESGED
jgi:hypothetical protein